MTGLVVAILGVSRTYEDIQGTSLWRDAAAQVKSWIRQRLSRRAGETIAVTASDSVRLVDTVTVEVKGIAPPPSEDAPVSEWIGWLQRRVERIDADVDRVKAFARQEDAALEVRLRGLIDDVGVRLDEVDEIASTAHLVTVGPDGVGLRRTAVGLAVTAIGVILTSAGLPW